MPGHIVAMGGFGGWGGPVVRFAIELAPSPRPRLLFVPTAVGDDDEVIAAFHDAATGLGVEPDHLTLFGVPDRPRARVADADVIVVGGGNTANMLAVWRVHGIDEALRRAWDRGAVLAGWSAGANCWFEASATDSFGIELDPLHDGLGLLAGSFCPHYDGEERRRPVFERLVGDGVLPPGYACDDDAALHVPGTAPAAAVAGTVSARVWRVDVSGSTQLDTRVVG